MFSNYYPQSYNAVYQHRPMSATAHRERFLAAQAQAQAAEAEYLAAVAREKAEAAAKAAAVAQEEALRYQRQSWGAGAYARGPVEFEEDFGVPSYERSYARPLQFERRERYGRGRPSFGQGYYGSMKPDFLHHQGPTFTPPRAPRPAHAAASVANGPQGLEEIFKFVLGEQPSAPTRSCGWASPAACRRAPAPAPGRQPVEKKPEAPTSFFDILQAFSGSEPVPERRRQCQSVCAAKPAVRPRAAPVAAPPVARPSSGLSMKEQLLKASSGSAPASKPSATAVKRENNEELQTIEHILGALFGTPVRVSVKSENAPSTSAPSTSTKPATANTSTPPLTTSSSAQPATTPFGSLKDQLEARLAADPDVEVQDTIRALMASLEPSPAPRPAPQTTPAPAAGETTPTSSKGKGKATVPTQEPVDSDIEGEPSPEVVNRALDSIRNVEATFHLIASEFKFPSTLDFSPAVTNSAPGTPTSTHSSATEKLSYKAVNAPVRSYEHALSSLLTQLDGISSGGSEDVRAVRRAVVNVIEEALEAVEKEVDEKWGNVLEMEILKNAPAVPEPSPAGQEHSPVIEVAPSSSEDIQESVVSEEAAPVKAVADALLVDVSTEEAAPAYTEAYPEVEAQISVDESSNAAEEPIIEEPVVEAESLNASTLTITPAKAHSELPEIDTIQNTDTSGPSIEEDVDTYLLPASAEVPVSKVPASSDLEDSVLVEDVESGSSDGEAWSELDE